MQATNESFFSLQRIFFFSFFFFSTAAHATTGRRPPQPAPCTSILSHSHPLPATNFLNIVSPSPPGSSSHSSSFSGCPLRCYPDVAHSGYMSCPLSSHALHSLPNISFTIVLDLITSSRIMSLFVMFNNDLFMPRWATASFLCWSFVRVHVSAP